VKGDKIMTTDKRRIMVKGKKIDVTSYEQWRKLNPPKKISFQDVSNMLNWNEREILCFFADVLEDANFHERAAIVRTEAKAL